MNPIRRLAFALALVARLAAAGAPPPYLNPSLPVETRVEDLLGRLTLEEKIALLHGNSKFSAAGVPRLGVPTRWLSDGPQGVREEIGPYTWDKAGWTNDFSTYLPAPTALAATWNTGLARAYGETIGQEARRRGKDIMLGPAINIQRTPLCGRDYEYFSEDPFLAARMAVASVQGAQAQDIASCVKHYDANNQEWDRRRVDVRMDERTLREIYLPAFRAAVQEGGAWAVMAAYNMFRGQYCSENGYLLNQVLKREWGFRGLVVSDWGAVHSTLGSALNGLDLEMGSDGPYEDFYFARPLLEDVRQGLVPMAVIDDMVRRNLRVMIATHVLDSRPPGSINTPQHQATARRVAEEGIVLLKNEGGALPLDPSRLSSLAVIGDNAVRLQAHGGESAEIKAFYEVTPLQGILRRVGSRVNVTYSAGYGEHPGPGALERAVRAARAADVAIVVGGLNHTLGLDCEGGDRTSLRLPYGQDELISRVVQANPRTIVVLISGAPVVMDPWLDRVPAVLEAWYPGMEGGDALAAILFGDVNPSGKLPCTFPRRLEDSPAHALHAYVASGPETYKEGLLVGYRWFDAKGIEPLFPFGYGLSYTRFAYSGLAVRAGPGASATVEFTLANAGARAGAEVAELYLHEAHPRLERPEKELKGFRKVFLRPGESRRVSIPLDRSAFAYYDPARRAWVAQADDFEILVGSSSRDIRLRGRLRLPQATVFGP